MDLDFPSTFHISQPLLFDYMDSVTSAVELFPAVWSAAEDITSSDSQIRRSGLTRLNELNAPRVSPLVAYLVASRVDDPDLAIRQDVITTLSQLLSPDEFGHSAPDNVRRSILSNLGQVRTDSLMKLLEVVVENPEIEPHLFQVLKVCPQAGAYLSEIAADRQVDIRIRKYALHFIGQVGYTEAISSLEKLSSRLEARLYGQQSMSFVSPSVAAEEADLLPALNKAISLLKAP